MSTKHQTPYAIRFAVGLAILAITAAFVILTEYITSLIECRY